MPEHQESVESVSGRFAEGRAVSLIQRGSWGRFAVAVALISVIPSLTLLVLLLGPVSVEQWTSAVRAGVVGLVLCIILLGYGLLIRYPKTTVQLRSYLRQIARDELPEGVHLAHDENDIAAIEQYLNAMLDQARKKVAMIEAQREALLQAERQRVMIESLGAACHHIGQPATALAIQLDLLKGHAATPEQRREIDECIETAQAVGEILKKLRETSQYRTEPYMPAEDPSSEGQRIIAF